MWKILAGNRVDEFQANRSKLISKLYHQAVAGSIMEDCLSGTYIDMILYCNIWLGIWLGTHTHTCTHAHTHTHTHTHTQILVV